MTRQWDEKNRPIGYILGVTPGFSEYEHGDNRLAYMGFARKITKAARLGFEFAEIDFEQLSEALEPEISYQVKRVKEANAIEIGIHLPVGVDLTLADAFSWRYMHDQVKIGAKAAAEIGAKFILFHTSSHMRPNITSVFGRPEPRQKLVGPDGTNLGDWIKKNGLQNWFMAKFIKVMFNAMGAAGDPAVIEFFEGEDSFEKAKQKVISQIEIAEKRVNEIIDKKTKIIEDIKKNPNPTPEEQSAALDAEKELRKISSNYDGYVRKELISMIGEEKATQYFQVAYYLTRYNISQIFDYWSRQGSEAEENVAYMTVAQKMFRENNPIWKIVKTSEDPDKLAQDAVKRMGTEAVLPEYVKQIVAAVAGEYLKGHLFAKGQQYGIETEENGKKEFISIYEFCKKNKVHIFIETAMPERGGEGGELRLIRVNDHIEILKAIDGGENVSYCMDFEHLITNLIDPIKESLNIQKGDGKYIRMVHVNAPRPITGAHAPLDTVSLDMIIIYRWMYNLRMAGMTNAYMMWEMGSYGPRQSAIAFRNITKELTKDPPTPPEKLPPEFFGIDEAMKARQMVAISQHTFDPIKGLMVVPEEEWTMLGEAARRRGKGQEWERRKYR